VNVALWHPAETSQLQEPWQRRAAEVGLDQPVDQLGRDVTIAQSKAVAGRYPRRRGGPVDVSKS